MTWRLFVFCSLCFGTISATSLAEDKTAGGESSIHVLQLHHLSPDEARSILQPFIGANDTLGGHGNSLILRSDNKTLSELQTVLRTIDVVPRNVIITVRFQAAHYPVPGAADEQIVIAQTRPREREALTQTLRTRDGRWAEILSTESHPLLERTIAVGRHGVVLEENIRLLDLSTGFRILPRLQNDQVSLDIAARHDTGPTPSQNSREQVLTTLDTTIGQWVELGGTRTGLPADNTRQYSTRPKEPQTTRVFIRIDLPPR